MSAAPEAVDLLLALAGVPSLTGSERAVLTFLENRFRSRGFTAERVPVSEGRFDLFVHRGAPRVVFTTHADTVPPFFPPRREGDVLFARGACDAKASLAAQVVALEEVARETREVGLLVLVGEERGSDGALAANLRAPESVRYLIGGEPTENRFVRASKGCLRIRLDTIGEAAHSSLQEDGRSAIHTLLDVLQDIRSLPSPADPFYGPTAGNIGTLSGGEAPNVLAPHASAEMLFRTGEPISDLLGRLEEISAGRATLTVPYRSEPIRFRCPKAAPDGGVVSFACDLPLLDRWGEPLLIGPGSIRDAHAASEKIALPEVERAVEIYAEAARGLLEEGEDYLAPITKR